MATEQEQICITLKAEGDLSSYQYRAVKVTNSGYGTLALATSDIAVGIQLNKPAAYGRALKVCVGGHTKAIAGDAVTIGRVGMHSAGALATISTTQSNLLGYALTTASGTGVYFEMIVCPSIY